MSFATPTNPIAVAPRRFSFRKSARILRSVDFRRVYRNGFRVSCPYFAAFCLQPKGSEAAGPKVGFTVPRALGCAVVRNRIRRRVREAVRQQLGQLGPGWEIVFNPRRSALTASAAGLRREIERLIERCKHS